jgi:hypothetical protein
MAVSSGCGSHLDHTDHDVSLMTVVILSSLEAKPGDGFAQAGKTDQSSNSQTSCDGWNGSSTGEADDATD